MEATNGADWEWHIIGRRLTFKMRVQAKRIRQDDRLRIRHKVKSSGQQQRDLLMSAARTDRLRPVYCIYCTEAQRAIWNRPILIKGLRPLQTGCLLANARDVPEATTRLPRIENVCAPWHYLCIPRVLWKTRIPDDFVATAIGPLVADNDEAHPVESGIVGWDAPSIDDLNGFGRERFDSTGVHETNEGDLESAEPGSGYNLQARERESERLLEREIHRWMVIDVRGEPRLGYQDHFYED